MGPSSGISRFSTGDFELTASTRAIQIGLVYWPRLPSRLTTTITVNQTRQGGPCRRVNELMANTTVNPPR